jgi:hypothetical protein
VAVVQMDGGRLQILDRRHPERNPNNTFWREMKVGCLLTMHSHVSPQDPCPELPNSFVDPERMRELVRQIKGFSGSEGQIEETSSSEESATEDRPGRPQPLARSVVASRHSVDQFAQLLASEAYWRGFAGAHRGQQSGQDWGQDSIMHASRAHQRKLRRLLAKKGSEDRVGSWKAEVAGSRRAGTPKAQKSDVESRGRLTFSLPCRS